MNHQILTISSTGCELYVPALFTRDEICLIESLWVTFPAACGGFRHGSEGTVT